MEQIFQILKNKDLTIITDGELDTLKDVSDDQLLRASRTLDAFAIVESNRQLKNTLQKEEKAIMCLTYILVILTIIFVGLTLILVYKKI